MNSLAKARVALEAALSELQQVEVEHSHAKPRNDNRKRLTRRDAELMRERWASGDWKQCELADTFAVNPATVSRILSGIYWK